MLQYTGIAEPFNHVNCTNILKPFYKSTSKTYIDKYPNKPFNKYCILILSDYTEIQNAI